MTEMASLCWGQNEHDNQPVHHWLWTFIALDNSTQGSCAARGQYWLRQAMTRLHSPGSDMYCGDEDNGEVGAVLDTQIESNALACSCSMIVAPHAAATTQPSHAHTAPPQPLAHALPNASESTQVQMASWYLLATMGLYALAPGTPDYVLGAPLFAHMRLAVEGSNATIDIVANNSGPDNYYVQVRGCDCCGCSFR